jgi:membrane protease YdiL (CAAX protease family)
MKRLWVEFVALYVALPVILLAARRMGLIVPILPILWVAAYPAARYLVTRHGWGAKQLIGFALTRNQAFHLVLRLVVAAAVLTVGIWVVAPDQLFELPRTNPRLWALVLVCYPILSVYPQGILYRGLFYARYARLFRTENGAWLAGSAVFSLAHLVFANPWAITLTFIGGLFINRTYRKTGSMLTSDLEHAVYGQLVFTVGWGRFLYHGTTRLLERAMT